MKDTELQTEKEKLAPDNTEAVGRHLLCSL